jgi:hypothetical protein
MTIPFEYMLANANVASLSSFAFFFTRTDDLLEPSHWTTLEAELQDSRLVVSDLLYATAPISDYGAPVLPAIAAFVRLHDHDGPGLLVFAFAVDPPSGAVALVDDDGEGENARGKGGPSNTRSSISFPLV